MINRILKEWLSFNPFDPTTIILVKEGTNITSDSFCNDNAHLFYFNTIKDCEESLRLLSKKHPIALLDEDNTSFFMDRAYLSNYLNIDYTDYYEKYVCHCLENIYHIPRTTITNGVKREFLKAFFDSNQITTVEIPNLHGENGLFYKSFCNDISIIIKPNQTTEDLVTLFINGYRGHTQLSLRIENLFSILFFKTIMSKSWRSECFYSLKPVLKHSDIFQEIAILDQGETSVIFSDSEGNYTGTRFLSDYKTHFPAPVPKNQVFVQLAEDSEMIEQSCFLLLNYYNESIPFIDESGIKGYIKKRNEQRFSVSLHWEIIDNETLELLLNPFDRILFSSNQKDLMVLHKRIKNWKDTEILNNSNYVDLLNGKYDLIISNCDIWDHTPVNYIHLKHLYINAYCAQMKNLFDTNSIEYHFLSLPDASRIVNHSKRVASESKRLINNVIQDNGTFTIADGIIDNCIYYHGRRRTTDVPLIWHKTIYFFGPCISIGIFAKDENTIESHLQRKLNSAGLPFRVINIPTPLLLNPFDSAINTLHKIGMEKYRKGDVVIHFGRDSLEWGGIIKKNEKKHDLTNLFNTPENIPKKCFIGHMGAHMNSVGYQVIAEYIFKT